ncbi:transcription antitermination protein RfaH [bacterium BMS3Abin03]|nr:transcription antitermination protein RfaH [bacterium BMS3Abin03]
MDTMAEKYWFALYTKPRNEFRAELQLTERGVDNYLPTIIRLKQWSDRKKKVTEPLLRSYIFIYANEAERLIAVEQRAVVRCLFDQGRPARIPEWQIDSLKKMLETKADVIVHNGIIPGSKIIIKSGPFEGITGTVLESKAGKSISVTIELLNRSVIAKIPDESILDVIRETPIK